ncbi:hypothetical protein B6A42_19850 [Vibrio coralliilyticus]|nr:hypothetical protein B6A42_19850 [Vibrio coralliilyticus]
MVKNYQAKAFNSQAQLLDITEDVQWTSSDTSVLRSLGGGAFIAVSEGEATVSVSYTNGEPALRSMSKPMVNVDESEQRDLSTRNVTVDKVSMDLSGFKNIFFNNNRFKTPVA